MLPAAEPHRQRTLSYEKPTESFVPLQAPPPPPQSAIVQISLTPTFHFIDRTPIYPPYTVTSYQSVVLTSPMPLPPAAPSLAKSCPVPLPPSQIPNVTKLIAKPNLFSPPLQGQSSNWSLRSVYGKTPNAKSFGGNAAAHFGDGRTGIWPTPY